MSALIHCLNQERTLGRTLESLHAIDEIVVVDHGSTDSTIKIGRQYGAKIVKAVPGVDRGAYAVDCSHDWIFCILPNEILGESLEASLFEWKSATLPDAPGFAVHIRAQVGDQWRGCPPEMRLADRTKINWQDTSPAMVDGIPVLPGDLLRLSDDEGEGTDS